MSKLNLPEGADLGFRLVYANAFGIEFTAHIYGARRKGWFIASFKGWGGEAKTIGPQLLPRGGWREFLGLIKQSGFWELPSHLPPDTSEFDDGEWLFLAGRNGERYHEVAREIEDIQRMFYVLRFLQRLSGFFPEQRPPQTEAPDEEAR